MTASPGGVRRPSGPSFPRRTTLRKPSENQLSFEFDYQKPTISGVKPKRAAPSPQTALGGRRNLRALQAEPVVEPMPTMHAFDSTRVAEAGYSTASRTLYVRFKDGTPWQYNNVEPNVWRNFRRSQSQGKFINRVLNNYSYGRSTTF